MAYDIKMLTIGQMTTYVEHLFSKAPVLIFLLDFTSILSNGFITIAFNVQVR